MSWDADIYAMVDGVKVSLHDGGWNYTHNTNEMIRKAGFAEWPYKVGGQGNINPMDSKTFADKMASVIENMEKAPDEYRKMNPQNGWGSFDTLLPILKEMLEIAKRFPSGVWEVWG
jgi:hypothetical protein